MGKDKPIEMTSVEFMGLLAQLPSIRDMEGKPRYESRYALHFISDAQKDHFGLLQPPFNGMPPMMQGHVIQFEVVRCDRQIPYWQPMGDIFIVPVESNRMDIHFKRSR